MYKLTLLFILIATNCYALQPDRYPNLKDKENFIMAPLGENNRGFNTTGFCVWCSTQNAARQMGITKLFNLVRDDSRCRGGANPSDVSRVLNSYGIKFKQEYNNRQRAYALLKEGLSEGRVCCVACYTAHVVNVCHYDELANKVVVVNNHQDRFETQYMDLAEFDRIFKGWVFFMYGPPEVEAKLKEWSGRKRYILADYYTPGGKKGKLPEEDIK